MQGKTTPWGTIRYEYDAENRLVRKGDIAYTNDRDGNTLSEKGLRYEAAYEYNGQNRMAYSEVTSHADRTHTVTMYDYDALGRRTLTQSVTGQTMRTLYDGKGFEVIREGEAHINGSLTTRYATGTTVNNTVTGQLPSSRYRWIGGDGSAVITTEDGYAVQGGRYGSRGVTLYGNGEAVAVSYSSSTGGRSVYLGKDILGSVKTATTDTGALEDRYEYDAFGTVYQGDLSGGMNLGYLGKPYDSATGLYNYGYRDYSPQAARFTTVDPARDGSNWYAYVNNDPVNWVDLWGLSGNDANNQPDINPKPTLSGWPVNSGRISSEWGPREEPIAGTGTFHSGIDIAVPNGTTVNATGNGTVTQVVNNNKYYGNMVVIIMDNGLTTADMHLQRTSVSIGDKVTTGQKNGETGTTGEYTTGGHDRFSVWDDRKLVPNFSNDNLLVPRNTIDPRSVLPSQPDTIR